MDGTIIDAASPNARANGYAAMAGQGPALRDWSLPSTIDRVYCPHAAMTALDWAPRYGWDAVVEQFDAGSTEVLPPATHHTIDADLRD